MLIDIGIRLCDLLHMNREILAVICTEHFPLPSKVEQNEIY